MPENLADLLAEDDLGDVVEGLGGLVDGLAGLVDVVEDLAGVVEGFLGLGLGGFAAEKSPIGRDFSRPVKLPFLSPKTRFFSLSAGEISKLLSPAW